MTKFAFMFPGQGSQAVGMLDAWDDHPAVRETLKEASAALGEDIGALIHSGPKEALALTTNTQPVMLVAAVAAWRAWKAEGGADPVAMAGHSLGEYSALVASDALTLREAVSLVRFRAAAMQQAVPVGIGAMAAILGLDSSLVTASCLAVSTECQKDAQTEVVEAVNFNDPLQTVIAGTRLAVEKACERLKAEGARRTLPLPVSAPFHSRLMQPAAERLREELARTKISAPRIPVINNIDVRAESDPALIRDALYRQAFGPVRWVECVQAMRSTGATKLVECGPGKVLAGMAKRIDPDIEAFSMFDPASLAEIRATLG